MRPIFFAAILTGMATTMLGPLLPGFAARWSLDDAQGGLLFVAQFIATLLAAPTVGFLGRRTGYWRLVAVGLVVCAAGVAGCASSSWTVAMFSVAVYGCGLGLAIPASNLGIAAASGGNSARDVLWLNLFWSIGAVGAPTLVATLHDLFLPVLAAVFVLMAIVVVSIGAGHRPEARAGSAKSAAGRAHVLFAVLLFLYVGAETAVAGWVSSYATRSASAQGLWAILATVFWGSILLGRVISPNILHRISPARLAPLSLVVALTGALVLVAGDGPLALLTGSALSGLGFAPIFPVVVAAYADLTAGTSASGFIFSAGGLGGALIPWLVGVVSTVTGSLRLGLVSVLALIVAMLWLIRRVMPQNAAPVATRTAAPQSGRSS